MFPGAQGADVAQEGLLQHLTVEKQDRLEGLVLGGGGDVLLDDEMGKKASSSGLPMSSGWRLS